MYGNNIYKEYNHGKKLCIKTLIWMSAILIGLCFGSLSASAQQVASEPWGFKAQNRASIAALMRQVEDANQTANAQAAPFSNDALVCGGGGGSSSATANSTCIILNNANAAIELGQDAQGNQGATSTGGTQAEAESPADEVLATLGNDQ